MSSALTNLAPSERGTSSPTCMRPTAWSRGAPRAPSSRSGRREKGKKQVPPKRTDEVARRLAVIRERVERGAYVVSFTHTEKLRRRRIRAQNIEEAIANGAIIEDYPDDPRGPSCLILGHSGERPIHAVCGRVDSDEILIITAYQPDPDEWESDWTTRKR